MLLFRGEGRGLQRGFWKARFPWSWEIGPEQGGGLGIARRACVHWDQGLTKGVREGKGYVENSDQTKVTFIFLGLIK